MASVTKPAEINFALPVNIENPKHFITARETVCIIALASLGGTALSTGAALGVDFAVKIITVVGFLNPIQALIVSVITFLASIVIFRGLQITQAQSNEKELAAALGENVTLRKTIEQHIADNKEKESLKRCNEGLAAQVTDLTNNLAAEKANLASEKTNREKITLKLQQEISEKGKIIASVREVVLKQKDKIKIVVLPLLGDEIAKKEKEAGTPATPLEKSLSESDLDTM